MILMWICLMSTNHSKACYVDNFPYNLLFLQDIFQVKFFLLTSCKIFYLGDRGANCQRLNIDIFVQTLLLEVYATMLIILKVTFSYITEPFVCK